jgi:Zinc finger, C2H2 type
MSDPCPICGKEFNRSFNLRRHKRNVHELGARSREQEQGARGDSLGSYSEGTQSYSEESFERPAPPRQRSREQGAGARSREQGGADYSEGAERGLSKGWDKLFATVERVVGGVVSAARQPTTEGLSPAPSAPPPTFHPAINPRPRSASQNGGVLELAPADFGDDGKVGNTGESLDGMIGGHAAPFQSVNSLPRAKRWYE